MSATCTTPRSALCRLYFDADDVDSLICDFHASLTEFEQRRASFSRAVIWSDPLLKAGEISKWHQQYSLPFATVFAYVAMKVTSKANGIGGVERNWADVNRA